MDYDGESSFLLGVDRRRLLAVRRRDPVRSATLVELPPNMSPAGGLGEAGAFRGVRVVGLYEFVGNRVPWSAYVVLINRARGVAVLSCALVQSVQDLVPRLDYEHY